MSKVATDAVAVDTPSVSTVRCMQGNTRQGPLVFYDGGCRICRREIAHYRRRDRLNYVNWVDITRCREQLAAYDIEFTAALNRLHVIDTSGRVRTGVAAFLCIWDELPGYRRLATLVRILRLQGILERAYAPLTHWRLRNRCQTGACDLDQ